MGKFPKAPYFPQSSKGLPPLYQSYPMEFAIPPTIQERPDPLIEEIEKGREQEQRMDKIIAVLEKQTDVLNNILLKMKDRFEEEEETLLQRKKDIEDELQEFQEDETFQEGMIPIYIKKSTNFIKKLHYFQRNKRLAEIKSG